MITHPTTSITLDLVAVVSLTGYSVGMNLPVDTTKVQAAPTLLTLPVSPPINPGASPAAQAAAIPTSGPNCTACCRRSL